MQGKWRILARTALVSGFAVAALAGCLSSGSDSSVEPTTTTPPPPAPPPPSPPPPPPPPPPPAAGNEAPSISGNPPAAVTVGSDYSFTPDASDPDGDTLTFTIQNNPDWATFDSDTGTLSGNAAAGTEGMYANIEISVSDGQASTSLPAFSIEVVQAVVGSATLTWEAPTKNVDGSALTDLAAYNLHYGTSSGSYTTEVRIDNPGITTYVVENLVADTYYFSITSVNDAGEESRFSGEAMYTVTQ